MATVEITSFGYLHDTLPDAHLTIDLRHHFRDPHISPELRYMTANTALRTPTARLTSLRSASDTPASTTRT